MDIDLEFNKTKIMSEFMVSPIRILLEDFDAQKQSTRGRLDVDLTFMASRKDNRFAVDPSGFVGHKGHITPSGGLTDLMTCILRVVKIAPTHVFH